MAKTYNTMTDGFKDYRPIIRVSTFERGDKVITVCVDRQNDFITHTYRKTNPFTSPNNKSFMDFIKSCGCRVVHHYHDGEYKYTCRYYGRGENNIELKKEF